MSADSIDVDVNVAYCRAVHDVSVSSARPFTIGELCAEAAVTPRTLRHYEDQGLLAPQRAGPTRLYSSRDRVRLRLILEGRSVGFSLAELREMLDLYDENDGGAQQMAASLVKFRERIAALRRQREVVDSAIESLEDGCVRLEARLGAMRPDLLPRAADYDTILRARLDGHDETALLSQARE